MNDRIATVTMLDDALRKLEEEQYDVVVYLWPDMMPENRCRVQIQKKTVDGAELQLVALGPTFTEALQKCLDKFPAHPLDGTVWKTKRLAKPDAEDAQVA